MLCALLMLATWRGPMPIVHAHYVGERDGITDGQLVQHLRIFHWRDSNIARIGWHFHIALPGQSSCGDETGDSGSPTDPLLAYGAQNLQPELRAVQTMHGGSFWSAGPGPFTAVELASAAQLLPAPEHGAFHNSLAAQVARTTMRAVTGVSLC